MDKLNLIDNTAEHYRYEKKYLRHQGLILSQQL